MNKTITQKWKDETIKQSKALALREQERSIRQEIDNNFLAKAIMIVSGLRGDIWQITKKDWNAIIKRYE